jgi:hypothetical protein
MENDKSDHQPQHLMNFSIAPKTSSMPMLQEPIWHLAFNVTTGNRKLVPAVKL